MHIQQGGRVTFELVNGQVTIRKITPLNIEFAEAIETTLSEWSSKEDDEAYRDL